jgi:cation diffusion facilitator CzcD-associated flavoprotein CzcO
MTEPQRKSVAVIGTGMAGLVIAYILRNDPRGRFDVEVFEKVNPNSTATSLPSLEKKEKDKQTRADSTTSKTNFLSTQHPTHSQMKRAAKSQNAWISPCAHSPTGTMRA